MSQHFYTKIIFKRELSHTEQYAFWRYALKSIKSISVTGATKFENIIEWKIDFSDSNLSEEDAKKQFTNFLRKQKRIIKDYSFYQLYTHLEAS